jgi:hypothetical protein
LGQTIHTGSKGHPHYGYIHPYPMSQVYPWKALPPTSSASSVSHWFLKSTDRAQRSEVSG